MMENACACHIHTHIHTQGHSHQIWSGQVSGACVSTQELGGSGGMPPPPQENFGNLESMRLLLRPFLGQNDAYRRSDDSFTSVHEHLPVAPYSTAWFWLSDRSLISQATPFADRSVGRTENCWKTRSFALFAAISYYVVTCHHAVCVPWAFAEHWPYLATPSKPQ